MSIGIGLACRRRTDSTYRWRTCTPVSTRGILSVALRRPTPVATATDRRLFVTLLAARWMNWLPYRSEAKVSRRPGATGHMFDLGRFFGLFPDLAGRAALHRAGSLLILQAATGAARSRSHIWRTALLPAPGLFAPIATITPPIHVPAISRLTRVA
jgi:uncharacterized protein (DUF1501 family)